VRTGIAAAAQRWRARLLRSKRERDIHRAFSLYLRPEEVKAIAASPEPLNTELKSAWLCCLLIQVRDDNPAELSRNAKAAIRISLKNAGVILAIMASIQLVAFGLFPFQGRSEEEVRGNSRNAAEGLIADLGEDVKIVEFSGDMPYGNIGDSRQFAFGIAPSNFDRFLARLLATEFGSVTRFPGES
jgi:hypothetical protein